MGDRTFSLFAFNKRDVSDHGERRGGLPEWRLPQAVAWAASRFDTILVEETGEPATVTRLATHHVCADPGCPGGCD